MTDSDFSELARSSARGSLVLMIGQLAANIFAALGVIVVANFLGSFSLGEVTKIMVPVNIAVLLNDFGVNAALTKYIAQYRYEGKHQHIRRLLEAGFVFNMVSASLSAFLLYWFAGPIAERFLLRPDLEFLVKVAALFILGNGLQTMAQGVLVGYDRMGLRSISSVTWAFTKAIVPPLLVWVGLGPLGAIIGNIISITLAGSVGMVFVLVIGRAEAGADSIGFTEALRLLLRFGFPIYLGTIVAGGLTQLNSSLINLYVGESLIGQYNAATNFGMVMNFITLPLATVLFPLFSKINSKRESLKPVFVRAVKYTSMVTLPAVLLLILLANPLVDILFPVDYPYTALYTQIYLLVFIFQGLGALAMISLVNGIGETHVSFKMNIVTLVVGAPLSLWLIPSYGIIGMLVSMIVAPRIGLFYGLWWVKKNLDIGFDAASSFSIYLSGGVAFAVCYLIGTYVNLGSWGSLVVLGGLFAILYVVLLPLTRGINKRDIDELKKLSVVAGPLSSFVRRFFDVLGRLLRA